jgi:hypothetical protein
MTTTYVYVGGPRDGGTFSREGELVTSMGTLDGRYVADNPPQLAMSPEGAAVILRFREKPAWDSA